MTTAEADLVQRFISYITHQGKRFKEAALYRYAQDYLDLDDETTRACLQELTTGAMLTVTFDLDSSRWLLPSTDIYDPLPSELQRQLEYLCHNKQSASEIVPAKRGRGAPIGNINSLKHGRYSKRISSPYGDRMPNDYTTVGAEIELLRSILADLDDLNDRPVDLMIKTATTIARLVVLETRLKEAYHADPPTN